MLLSASSSSSEWPFIAVCRATLLSTSWTAASLRLMLPVASGSTLQVATSSSCHVIVAPSSAVGRFLLQVRQPGTRCQTISEIRRLANTLLGNCWRHTCLRCIRACSALEALRNALYKCSTYLLTYFSAGAFQISQNACHWDVCRKLMFCQKTLLMENCSILSSRCGSRLYRPPPPWINLCMSLTSFKRWLDKYTRYRALEKDFLCLFWQVLVKARRVLCPNWTEIYSRIEI